MVGAQWEQFESMSTLIYMEENPPCVEHILAHDV